MMIDEQTTASPHRDLDQHELMHWLALCQIPGIGAVTFQRLLKYFHSAKAVFSATQTELRQMGLTANSLRALLKPDWKSVEQQLSWASRPGNSLLASQSPDYPTLLHEITGLPPILFVQGNVGCLSNPQIAIVGSRKPSAGGKQIALEFAESLSQSGLTITSGLAYGIDSAAHQGALQSAAATIAVLGSGLSNIYPRRHKALASQIRDGGGALISEHPPNAQPLAAHFPRRNRVISGLSLATVVIEAGEKSGSLITARLALEQGRDVMAVPGAVQNPMAAGCHRLIQEGAALVTHSDDILANLNTYLPPLSQKMPVLAHQTETKLDASQHKVLYYVDYAPTSIDEIVMKSTLTTAQVSSILLALELLGHVSSAPGGMYTRLDSRV